MLLSQVMQYRVGDHVLDLRRFEVRKKGGVLPAEPQVLSLLFLLVENRDRLVSKDELVEVVWGGRAISDSAISSRIKSARQLLSDDGEAQRLIRTIHGKGFRFVGEVLAGETEIPEIPSDRNGRKPSIAVLPFDCEDAGLSVISHGVPHDLIVGLSRLRSLTVIARGSSFRFRGWTGDLSQIGSTLGVDYCLTGTVHRAGARVVVAVELVDARTSSVVWGELYEGTLDKLHEVRENILVQIVSTLELQISHHEAETARLRSPDDLSAWSCYHLGLQHIFRFNRLDNEHGLRYFEQAVGRDPTFSQAHAGVSFARFQNAFMRYSADAEEEAKLARRAAETAIELDEQDPTANLMLGRSFWLEGAIVSSVPWLERAIALSPNYAQAVYSRAWTDMILCQGEAGQQNARAAMRLSPIDPLRYAMIATDGFTQAMLGDEATGAALVDRAAREPRAHVMIAVMAAICQVWAENEQGICYWANEIKSRDPQLTANVFLTSFPFKDGPLRERVSAALSAIGV
ncbi:MAG TPA: winged helix-turn-helix domain-containing protein [Bauldia sp.]|nr:winged helix-turn-helix domain-containing protein [Bauldia sp.]